MELHFASGKLNLRSSQCRFSTTLLCSYFLYLWSSGQDPLMPEKNLQVISQNLALLDQTLNMTGISKASGHPAHLPEAIWGQIKISSYERNGELGTARDLLSSICRSSLVVISMGLFILVPGLSTWTLQTSQPQGIFPWLGINLLTISSKRDQRWSKYLKLTCRLQETEQLSRKISPVT